jgi:hypothetical protein
VGLDPPVIFFGDNTFFTKCQKVQNLHFSQI